jgi:hypothetical protein
LVKNIFLTDKSWAPLAVNRNIRYICRGIVICVNTSIGPIVIWVKNISKVWCKPIWERVYKFILDSVAQCDRVNAKRAVLIQDCGYSFDPWWWLLA